MNKKSLHNFLGLSAPISILEGLLKDEEMVVELEKQKRDNLRLDNVFSIHTYKSITNIIELKHDKIQRIAESVRFLKELKKEFRELM